MPTVRFRKGLTEPLSATVDQIAVRAVWPVLHSSGGEILSFSVEYKNGAVIPS